MAEDITGSVLRGFGLPYSLTPGHIWDDKASFTQQGPTAGEATPQGSYSLALQTAGTQSASKKLRVYVRGRGGHPGPGGATATYKYDGEDENGNDVQQTSATQVIRTTAATLTTALSDPDACTFKDTSRVDRIAVAYQRQTSSSIYNVDVSLYDPSDGTWENTTPFSSSTAPTDGYHPAIAYNPVDGHLYLAHWRYDTGNNKAQVAVHRYRTAWETVSESALDEPVDISGTPGAGVAGYEVGRLRMAFAGGQCLLVAHLIANNTSQTRDQIGQWASASRASSFTTIDKSIITISGSEIVFFSSHSVQNVRGKLAVFFPTVTNGNRSIGFMARITLPSAFNKVSSRATVFDNGTAFAYKDANSLSKGVPIDIPSGVLINDTDGSVWVSEDGTVTGAFRCVDSTATHQNAVYMVQSTDGGGAFKYVGDGDDQNTHASDAVVFDTGDSASYLTDFVGVAHRGRQVLIGLNATDVTSTTTLFALFLGGPSTVTLPARVAYPRQHQRSSWTTSYIPVELPANISTLTTSGAGTDTIGTNGSLSRVTTSGQLKTSHRLPVSTIAQGIIERYAITVNSGGSLSTDQCALKVRTADGTDDYEAVLRFTTSGFRMWDDNGGAQIGVDKTSVAPSGGIDVLVAVVNGKFSCWFRAWSSKSHRPWTAAIQDYSLTNDTATATGQNRVLWGIAAGAAVDLEIHEEHTMVGANTNGKLGEGFTNPDDLLGRPLPRRGRYIGIDDGVLVTAIDGSGMVGNEFHIDTAYDHPIERIFHSESPSPRTQWRSEAVTSGNVAEQFIPFVLNADATTLGSEEQGFGRTLCYMTVAGANWRNGTIERWDTGTSAWVTVATIDARITTTYSYTRRGSELHAPSLPTTSNGRYFYENECAGWTVKFGSAFRKITGNTAGTLASNVSGPKPTFFLEGIDGSEPTSSTLTLIPDTFTVVFHTDGETGGGWGLRISAQQTAPYTVNGTAQHDSRIGHLSMGRVFVFSRDYQHGRVLGFDSGDLTEDSPAGVRRGVRTAPGGRFVRVAWPEIIDTTPTQGSNADPDYLTSTTTAGNLPVAAKGDVAFSLLGVLQQVGAITPITYIPRIDKSGGGADTQHLLQRHEHLLAQVASSGQIENVLGDELDSDSGEAVRFSAVVLEEVQ